MEGLLKEAIGLGRLEDECDLLEEADSTALDLGDALLACREHKFCFFILDSKSSKTIDIFQLRKIEFLYVCLFLKFSML